MTDLNRHIALYLPSLRGGGAERVMVNLANGFAKRGITTDLVVASAVGPYLDLVLSTVNIVDLKCSRVLTSLPALARYLRKRQPNAMIATMGHANVVAILARMLSGTRSKIQLAVREANTVGISAREAPTLKGRIMPVALRFLYPLADVIVANSKGSAKDLSSQTGIPEERIAVIGNPVDIAQIRELSKASPPILLPKISSGQSIVSVGRLTPQKDFETLLCAFSLVLEVRPDVSLLILGEGELRQKLEGLAVELGIRDKLIMPGFVSNPYAVMKQADLFVLSSRWEGLPNTLLEALALGLPVVATDCPSGPAEILSNGKYGKLVPVGDSKALAKAILHMLDTPINRDLLESRAKKFSIDKIVDEFLDLFFLEKTHG